MLKPTVQKIILVFLILFFGGQASYSQNCGTERWSIKTLSDIDTLKIDFHKIIPSTVHEQIALEKTKGMKFTRLNSETTVYSINCFIVGYKRESNDKDIHIILEDIATDETMVAEIPNYECFEIQNSSRYELFMQLDKWFVKNIGRPKSKFVYLERHVPVVITGVGYFDFYHGQIGMANNGREIHPVLSIKLNQ